MGLFSAKSLRSRIADLCLKATLTFFKSSANERRVEFTGFLRSRTEFFTMRLNSLVHL